MSSANIDTALPDLLEHHREVLIQVPLRILFIVVLALLVRAVLHRSIRTLTLPVQTGRVPRILRPLRNSPHAQSLLATTGLASERRAQRAATIASALKSFVSFFVAVIAFLLIVGELGFDLAPFIAGTSIIGVALGFGAQNIVKDFLAGLLMIFEDQYGVGDVIDFEKASGTVEAVGLRVTKLRDDNGTVWYVRNGEVIRVGNKSQGYAQVVLDVPIAASEDITAASGALLDVARTLALEQGWAESFLAEPEVQGVEMLTREETTIRLVARVRPADQWRVARELRGRIRRRLDELAINARVAAPDPPAPQLPA